MFLCVSPDCTDIVFHDIGAPVLNFALPHKKCCFASAHFLSVYFFQYTAVLLV